MRAIRSLHRLGSTIDQIRSTCQYSRSTGVGRLKMISMTLTRPRASMTSSTVPSKFSNGPSLILTRSPRSTSIRTFGALGLGLGRLLAEHLVDLGLGHLGRRAVGPDEVADAGRLADREPGLLVQLHLDHDVAGIGLPLDDPLLVVADLGDLLGRDDDPAEEPLEPLDLDPPLEGVADRVLAASSGPSGRTRPARAAARRRRRSPAGARLGSVRRRRARRCSVVRSAGRPRLGVCRRRRRRRRPPSGVCSSTSSRRRLGATRRLGASPSGRRRSRRSARSTRRSDGS